MNFTSGEESCWRRGRRKERRRRRCCALTAKMRRPGAPAPAWARHAGSCVPKRTRAALESGERPPTAKQLRGTCSPVALQPTKTPTFSPIFLLILYDNSKNSQNKICSSTCALQHCLKARHQKHDSFEDLEAQRRG